MPRILLFLSLSILLTAQTPDTVTIHGHVTDASHAAVAGVAVKVTNAVSDVDRSAQTDGSGNFSITGLPIAGTYTITANKAGFSEARLADVTLAGGTTADLTLQLSVAGSESKVTVTGVPGEVRADSPQLGERLDSRTIQETPLLNNRITYLPLLDAANRQAINQGDVFMNEDLFTTNGAGRRQAWFEVDGVTGNDSWGRQTIFSNIPSSAVQEMNVLENGFSAEYGGSTGSAINIITKSGGNQFHGDVMELWRPAATEAALSGFSSRQRRQRQRYDQRHSGPVGRWRWAAADQIEHAFLRGGRVQPRESSLADHLTGRARKLSSATTAAGSRSCGWIIRSTTATTCFSAAISTDFTTPIPTASWAATACPRRSRVLPQDVLERDWARPRCLSPTLLNSDPRAVSARLADHGIRSRRFTARSTWSRSPAGGTFTSALRNRRC